MMSVVFGYVSEYFSGVVVYDFIGKFTKNLAQTKNVLMKAAKDGTLLNKLCVVS